MRITTTYTTGSNGKSKIVAKGGKKQRTVNYDHSLSIPANHGAAAGVLMRAHGLPFSGALVTVDAASGTSSFEV